MPAVEPSTALGPAALHGKTTKDLAFLAARHLTYYRPEHQVLVYFPIDSRREGETPPPPRLVARVSPRTNIREGARMELVADTRRLHFFDPNTGAAVR